MLCYLSLFIAVLLILLWLFQTVFLDSFYKMVKTRSIQTAADSIVRQLEDGDLSELAEAIALKEEVCVLALDGSYQKLASAEASRACVIHSAGAYALYQMVSAAEENGGSATLFRDENFMFRQNPFPGGRLSGIEQEADAQSAGNPPSLPGTENGSQNPAQGGARMGRPQSMVYVRLVDKADGSRVILLLDTMITPVDATVSTLRIQLVCITLLLALLAVGLAFLISRRISRPIIRLSDAAAQLAAGNYDVSFPAGGYREIDELADTLRFAAGELATVEGLRRELIANVSHDLRTPLTLIKGYAETVRDLTGDDKAHRDEQMNIIVDEADRLTALVSSVMELSKVTSGTYKCERVHFDMGQLCDEVSERYDAVCAQNGWQLKLELPEEELPVYADPDMMQRALHNLLGNAMHHIGQDGIFILRAFRCSEGVRVEVEDHGPGIAAADLPYIFDRYYRSRSDAGKQGTGLGLSITKAIFQQHSFRFGVQSTVGKGTTFWFVMSDLPYVDDFEGK